MSLNPDIRDRAYQFFIEEAPELLQVIETGLLDLRQNCSTPKVHELMRAAHSIKGGAAGVELRGIELLAHRLEDFFRALYSDDVEFDAELEKLLLEAYDCLSNPLIEQLERGKYDEEAALLAAEPIFAALEFRLADALKNSDNYIPSSNDLGVDIVASIFEVDVAKALEHLVMVESNPSNYNLAAELGQQLEMFAGFAELFNLPGLDDIVRTAQSALATNPQHIKEIIKATIADCSLARELVLKGDRQQGGEVSPTLKRLAENTIDTIAPDSESTVSSEALELSSGNLWSNLSSVELNADDIFNEDAISKPEIEASDDTNTSEALELTSDNLWSNLSSAELDVDDIFNDLSEKNEPEIAASDDTNTSEAIELTSDNLWSNLSSAELDVDDIFNDSSENNSGMDDFNELLEMIAQEQLPQDSNALSPTENNLSSDSPASQQQETNDSSIPSTEDDDPTKNITAAIASIENIYDRLPNSVPDDFAEPIKTIPTPVQKLSSVPTTHKLTVKVDLDRLERMNNLVGELTINRNSLTLQNEQLQENVSELRQRFLRFSEITKKVMAISDRMLIEQRSDSSLGFQKPSFEYQNSHEEIDRATEFDALEMDSYGVLHTSLQEVLEEIVQLDESVDDVTIFAQQSDRTIEEQRQMLDRMRDELMWVRMLPLKQILQRFPRTLRDLSHDYQKPVELKLTGTDVLVDRAVLEKLADPLLHLLRNSFDHGIEEPEVRLQQGKPATGSIEIRAYYQSNQTVIEVKDDGRGLDLAKIAKRGIERGLISAQEASASPQRLYDLIFEPGFSTANRVSEISGRGVGMNIVRSQIETLKGKISVTSSPGEGSIFTMRLPLTLTIAKLLVCSLGATTFAIPSDSIEEIIIPTAEQIKFVRQQKFLSFNDRLIPIYCLNEVLQYNCPIPDSNHKPGKTVKPPEDWLAPLLSIRRGQQLFALEVVSLLSEQELVIKPYGKAIAAPEYCYGCTILSDGSLIPIFNGSALLGTLVDERNLPVSRIDSQQQEITAEVETQSIDSLVGDRGNKVKSSQAIMIVDDSTAHRRTMALTLEKQGYRVIQCKDGKEALDGFKRYPNLDLIICDIEMPVMNGFEFLTVRRRDSALSQIPTFMLTSRSGAKHRQLAMQLGANGYFTKPYIEPEFVAEVNQILQNNSLSGYSHLKSANFVRSKTILVIDDSSALRRTLASSLENKGYRVLQARDGLEGLELWRHNLQIDLVICDVEMPNMNGFEFLTMRRREPDLKDVPVIMLTSRNTDKHRTLATSLGATEFFTKPYVEERFLQDITQFIS